MNTNYPPGVRERDINDAAGDVCADCGAFPLYRNSGLCRRCWDISRADDLMDQERDDRAMEQSSVPDGMDAGQPPQPLPLAHQPADANCGGNGLCRTLAGDNLGELPVNPQPRAGVNNRGLRGDSDL